MARIHVPMRSVLFGIAFIAILMSGVILRLSVTDFSRPIMAGDETTYHNAALSLLERGIIVRNPFANVSAEPKYTAPSSALAPGYPAFLAAMYTLLGVSSFPVFVAQAILSIGSLILTAGILNALGVRGFPFLAAVAAASLYPGSIYNLNRMLTETLFIFLLLVFVFAIIRCLKTGRVSDLSLAALAVGCAVQVRTQALPVAILGLAFIVFFAPGNRWIRSAGALIFLGILSLTMTPWWIYTYQNFGRVILVPTSGVGAMIWGAVPYYLDMVSTSGKDLSVIIAENSSVAPSVYWNWRIFGYLQYMWFDYWDENLVHPLVELKYFLPIQHLVVIPALCTLPLLIRKGTPEHLFVAAIPIIVTYLGAPFHGLPRYAAPAVPLLFVAAGCLWQVLLSPAKKPIRFGRVEKILRCGGLVASVPLSLAVAYSTIFFPWRVAEEMSRYRVAKYIGESLDRLVTVPEVEPLVLGPSDMVIQNVTHQSDGTFINDKGAAAILKIPVPQVAYGDDRVVTRVDMRVDRSLYVDYATLYWKGLSDNDYSENKVYRPPVNMWSKNLTVYIDGDAAELMIVPVYYRNQEFLVEEVRIQKLVAPR